MIQATVFRKLLERQVTERKIKRSNPEISTRGVGEGVRHSANCYFKV